MHAPSRLRRPLGSDARIREDNTRYHDVAAATYDAKWGIDFGETGQSQVLSKLRKLLSTEPLNGYGKALEIGAGTGYLGLNLLRAGLIAELTCTDISGGMVDALRANAKRLGLVRVTAVQADAESLPFEAESFDLVIGHAVLHHLPDLERAFAEFRRVLLPGGRILFAGEPSRIGDRMARLPKRAAAVLAPAWRQLVGAAVASEHHARDHADHRLESHVDIHTFSPAELERLATSAGLVDIVVRGEELVANWFGWFNRSLEASAHPDGVPMWWRRYAFHGYLTLQQLDARVLEPHLPTALFYNLMMTARRPESAP